VSLAAIAVHLPAEYVRRHPGPLLLVAVLGTTLMWLAAGAVVGVTLGLGVIPALLIGAILAPTDPVLAGSVVTGPLAKRNIPQRLRHLLYAESAANDGLALVAVMLPILLWQEADDGRAWWHWAWHTVGWQVLCGMILGAAAGFALGWLQQISERFELSDQRGMLPLTLALSLAVLGGLKLLDTDALLAVFVAAVAFHYVARDALEQSQEHIQDAMQRFVQLPVFVLLGTLLPWKQWLELGWPAMALILGILLLRRCPAWLLLKPVVRPMRTWRDAAFLGWFGPIGLSAIYYATLAHRHTHNEQIWPVTTLVVTASILLHGITAVPAGHWLRRHEPPAKEEEQGG
jgi:NhaP-type Na+/H+ or K+/H+ antiporter